MGDTGNTADGICADHRGVDDGPGRRGGLGGLRGDRGLQRRR